MKTYSPLRYPGGKSAMSDLLVQVRHLNQLGDRCLAEPFAGGAGAALALLFHEETERICINDADRSIYDLWWTLTHRPQPFIDRLSRTRVSMAEWRRQRETYRHGRHASRLSNGFAAFYLNRCNRSGIIMNGGPIGGTRQQGRWKLNARFNKRELIARCERIAEYRDRIDVSNEDGIAFIERLGNSRAMFFIDPPYYQKGPLLYLNGLDHDYHVRLSEVLHERVECPWVLTYDDCREVRAMYRGWASIRSFSLRYSAAQRRMGREILITPRWMRLPREQQSMSVRW